MKKIKRALCLISSIFAISAATLTASALNGSGTYHDVIKWNVKDNILNFEDTAGNWTAEGKSNTLYVKGQKLENIAVSSEGLFTPENAALTKWLTDNTILKVHIDVNEVNAIISLAHVTNNVSQVTIGKNVKNLSGSCKVQNENLKNIVVAAKDIKLDGTDIGYNTDGEPIEDLTIYGYEESTAVDYAQNNGFEFRKIGDVNNDNKIGLQDIIKIARYMLGSIEFDDEETITADYNGDNFAGLQDIIGIAKELLRKK